MADPGPVLKFGRSFALFWDFVGTVLAGALIGWFIDSRFDTEPYWILGLMILGSEFEFARRWVSHLKTRTRQGILYARRRVRRPGPPTAPPDAS